MGSAGRPTNWALGGAQECLCNIRMCWALGGAQECLCNIRMCWALGGAQECLCNIRMCCKATRITETKVMMRW
jgi:hypothetical protein